MGDGSGSNDEDDNESCGENDSNFLFKGRRNKGCDWVGQTAKRAEKLCPKMSEGKKVSESCPATCGSCSNDCEDDSNFLFKGRKNKGCDWVGKVTKRAERLCPMMSEGKKVSESCPVACGTCSNDGEDDEEEGSGSEDQEEDEDEEEGSGSEDQEEEEGSGSEDQEEEEESGSEDQDEEEGSSDQEEEDRL